MIGQLMKRHAPVHGFELIVKSIVFILETGAHLSVSLPGFHIWQADNAFYSSLNGSNSLPALTDRCVYYTPGSFLRR